MASKRPVSSPTGLVDPKQYRGIRNTGTSRSITALKQYRRGGSGSPGSSGKLMGGQVFRKK